MMKESTRAKVAAAVGAAMKRTKVSSVYDYQAGRHRQASANVSGGRVNGFDYDTSSHFAGGGGGKLDFFDYEASAHVQLKVDGNNFSGFDYHTGFHFSGHVNGNSLSLYDYETGQHYNFAI